MQPWPVLAGMKHIPHDVQLYVKCETRQRWQVAQDRVHSSKKGMNVARLPEQADGMARTQRQMPRMKDNGQEDRRPQQRQPTFSP